MRSTHPPFSEGDAPPPGGRASAPGERGILDFSLALLAAARLRRAPGAEARPPGLGWCALVLLVGCGGPQVTITLTRADDLNPDLPVPFVRFAFRTAETVDEPLVQGPFSINGVPQNDLAEIAPNTEFSVDVAGCNEQAEEACSTEINFIARGCEGGFTRARDETLEITIALHPANVGNALCPVEDPEIDAEGAEEEGG